MKLRRKKQRKYTEYNKQKKIDTVRYIRITKKNWGFTLIVEG